MDYQIERNLVKITAALAELLTGKTQVAVEFPYTDNDFTARIVGEDYEVE